MLRMFDAEAAVLRSVLVHNFLEEIEHGGDSFVANCVDAGLEPDSIKTAESVTHFGERDHVLSEQAAGFRVIDIWLEEIGSAGTERAVGKTFESSHPKERRPEGMADSYLGQVFPSRNRWCD